MQIISVSRGTYSGGKQLADKLASDLGYRAIGREEVTDAATAAGIPVGKLELATVKRGPLTERLAVERSRFKAFVTAFLCERALQDSVVYHGRTGHMVLPGVEHVFRVRAIMDMEDRITATMRRLNLSWDKALEYNTRVDEDRHRWARLLYNLNWEDPSSYDVVVNFTRMSVTNAASALVHMAELPEFRCTPRGRQQLEDLLLAARCRLRIGDDPRTRGIDVQVRAARGRVAVSFLPRYRKLATAIPEVLADVEGVAEVRCTMASTNILWVQERFGPEQPTLAHILEIARRWNAAVETVKLTEGPARGEVSPSTAPLTAAPAPLAPQEALAGILDDSPETADEAGQDPGLSAVVSRLVEAGHAGGVWSVAGGPQALAKSLDHTVPYSLVVIGDLFLSKGEAVRGRMRRETGTYLADAVRVPVIGAEELEAHYLFGPRQWVKLLVSVALVTGLVLALFRNQQAVLAFLVREGTLDRVLAVSVIALAAPGFAYLHGGLAQLLMKLFKFE